MSKSAVMKLAVLSIIIPILVVAYILIKRHNHAQSGANLPGQSLNIPKLEMTQKLADALGLANTDLKNIETDMEKAFENSFETYRAPDSNSDSGADTPKKIIVSNCTTLLKAREVDYQPPDPDLKIFESKAADCEALLLLKDGKLPAQTFVGDFKMHESQFALFSPILDLSLSDEEIEEAQSSESAGKNWQTYNPKIELKILDDNDLSARDGDEWTAEYFIYGRGDFNGDGFEDVLVKREGLVSNGTLQSSKLLVLTRHSAEGLVKVVDVR